MTAPTTYRQLAADASARIAEIAPWDLPGFLADNPDALLVDIREPAEYAAAHIEGAINVPRGIIEAACEWDYPETEPALAGGRDRPVVLVCRSGNRTALAAVTLGALGFADVRSLKLGLRGWNDGDLPLVDAAGAVVDGDEAAQRLDPPLRPDQRRPRD